MLRVHRLETDKWSWGFLRMNLLKFLLVKMSALVFRSIKHMSLTFFFPESPRITYCSWGTVKTDTDPDQIRTVFSVLPWCPYLWTGFHCAGSASEGSGIPVYPKKIRQNTQKYPKFIQIYPKLYPGILYTWNSKKVIYRIPVFKLQYTVYPI